MIARIGTELNTIGSIASWISGPSPASLAAANREYITLSFRSSD
ncbi:hypothetical protein HMPREF0307_00819 [Corynebacterium sp. DNF00584]|nr:hypothetical protein HMPREF0307_00819 [Corynebacterium sp. DNF00584]